MKIQISYSRSILSDRIAQKRVGRPLECFPAMSAQELICGPLKDVSHDATFSASSRLAGGETQRPLAVLLLRSSRGCRPMPFQAAECAVLDIFFCRSRTLLTFPPITIAATSYFVLGFSKPSSSSSAWICTGLYRKLAHWPEFLGCWWRCGVMQARCCSQCRGSKSLTPAVRLACIL